MEAIITYITQHGLPVFVIACMIIAIVGILKLCKVFAKIKSADVKKLVYNVIDIVLAFGISAAYFGIFHLNFNGYLIFSVTQISATAALYTIYENFGARKFVRYIIQLITKWIVKDPNSQLSKWADKVGLDEALKAIQDKITERDAQPKEPDVQTQPVADAENKPKA